MKKTLQAYFTISLFFISLLIPGFLQSQNWEFLDTLDNFPNLPAMAAAGGKIYVVSGNGNKTTFPTWEYDPATNSWSRKADIPQGCFWASAVGMDQKIYVMGGGQSYPGKTYNYIYHADSDKWTNGADLLTGRMYHSAAMAGGKIYILGGQNGDGTSEWYFDEYDPVSNSWSGKARLLQNGAWYCAAAGVGSKFYRIAGGGSNINLTKDYFEEYDITSNNWKELPKFRIKLHAPAAVTMDGKIILMGGYTNGNEIDSMYIYDPVFAAWSVMQVKLPYAMCYHKAAVIGNCLYVYDVQKGYLMRHCGFVSSVNKKLGNINDKMDVFPNPCNGNFSIKINFPVNEFLNLKIYNSSGQEMKFSLNTSGNNEELQVNIFNPRNGLYFISFKNGGKIFSCKFLVQ